MSDPNSPNNWRKPFSLKKLHILLVVFLAIIPAVNFLCSLLGLHDIYWKEQAVFPDTKQSYYSAYFQIFNKSFLKSPQLMFYFVALNVPQDKIYYANRIRNQDELFGNPDNILLIDLCGQENTLTKQKIGNNNTKMEIERDKGLGAWEDTHIMLHWRKGSYIVFYGANLSSKRPESMNHKIYPHESKRKWWKQIEYQVTILLLILTIILLRKIKILSTTIKEGQEPTAREPELTVREAELASMTINVNAQNKFSNIEGEEILPLPKTPIPVEEDIARKYQQKTKDEMPDEKDGRKHKSSKNQNAKKPIKNIKRKSTKTKRKNQ